MAKHLGNYIRSDMRDSDDIQHKRGDFIVWINNLIVNFGKCRHMVKQNIFNSQYSHVYGCESWNHMELWVDNLEGLGIMVFEEFFSLPYITHTRFLNLLIDRPYVTDQMLRQFYKMILSMLHNENDRLTYLTQIMIEDSCSIITCNMQVICKQYGKNFYRTVTFQLKGF